MRLNKMNLYRKRCIYSYVSLLFISFWYLQKWSQSYPSNFRAYSAALGGIDRVERVDLCPYQIQIPLLRLPSRIEPGVLNVAVLASLKDDLELEMVRYFKGGASSLLPRITLSFLLFLLS